MRAGFRVADGPLARQEPLRRRQAPRAPLPRSRDRRLPAALPRLPAADPAPHPTYFVGIVLRPNNPHHLPSPAKSLERTRAQRRPGGQSGPESAPVRPPGLLGEPHRRLLENVSFLPEAANLLFRFPKFTPLALAPVSGRAPSPSSELPVRSARTRATALPVSAPSLPGQSFDAETLPCSDGASWSFLLLSSIRRRDAGVFERKRRCLRCSRPGFTDRVEPPVPFRSPSGRCVAHTKTRRRRARRASEPHDDGACPRHKRIGGQTGCETGLHRRRGSLTPVW